ncbi:MAG: hypothetical protein IH621_15360 [Krumholzibacteria bacterium]|nr:hypothetical protein [Candidatus Krumholzibacteria bacterium]
MRGHPALLILATVMCLLPACGEDDATCPAVAEQPLAQYVRVYSGSVGQTIGSLRIDFSYATGDTLFHLSLDESDKERKFTIDADSSPDFARAVAMLTNGVNDNILLYLRGPAGAILSGGGTTEQLLWQGGYSGEYFPDLQGAEITRLDVTIDDIWFTTYSPPNTTYMLLYHAVVMGRP